MMGFPPTKVSKNEKSELSNHTVPPHHGIPNQGGGASNHWPGQAMLPLQWGSVMVNAGDDVGMMSDDMALYIELFDCCISFFCAK